MELEQKIKIYVIDYSSSSENYELLTYVTNWLLIFEFLQYIYLKLLYGSRAVWSHHIIFEYLAVLSLIVHLFRCMIL